MRISPKSSNVLFWGMMGTDPSTTIKDSSANGYDVSTTGSPPVIKLRNGNYGLDFDGSGDNARTSSAFTVTEANSYTLAVWLNTDVWTYGIPFSIGGGAVGTWQMRLQVHTTAGNKYILLGVGKNGVAFSSIQITSSAFATGENFMLIGTYNASDNSMVLYYNGIEVASGTYSKGAGTSSTRMDIGSTDYVGSVNSRFPGKIMSPIVLNYFFNADQSLQLYKDTYIY